MIYDQIPFFSLCANDPDVVDLFGNDPVRIYPFGEAPQGVTAPYATFQDVVGLPENYLAGRPDADTFTLQVNVYADTPEGLRLASEAIIKAIELRCTVTHGQRFKDPDVRKYRVSFDADFVNCRGNF